MIVLIDAEKSQVTVYSDTKQVFSMQDTNGIAAAIKGQTVYYVTAAEEVAGDEIIEMLISLTGVPLDNTAPVSVQNNVSKKYIHPKANKQVTVKAENGKQITFTGINDIKNIEYIHKDILKSNSMKMFLETKVLEIISHEQRQNILDEIEALRQKMQKKQEQHSILVQSSEPGSAEKYASEGIDDGPDDAISIEISGEKSFKRDDEHLQNMKQLGLS